MNNWKEYYEILAMRFPRGVCEKILYNIFMENQDKVHDKVKYKIMETEKWLYPPLFERNIYNDKTQDYHWHQGGLVATWVTVCNQPLHILKRKIKYYGDGSFNKRNCISNYINFLTNIYDNYDVINKRAYKKRRDITKKIDIFEDLNYSKYNHYESKNIKRDITLQFFMKEIQDHPLKLLDY